MNNACYVAYPAIHKHSCLFYSSVSVILFADVKPFIVLGIQTIAFFEYSRKIRNFLITALSGGITDGKTVFEHLRRISHPDGQQIILYGHLEGELEFFHKLLFFTLKHFREKITGDGFLVILLNVFFDFLCKQFFRIAGIPP